METVFLTDIEDFLCQKIVDKSAVFVFTTDVVCHNWADWCVVGGHTSVKSVALNRFIAWDTFKRDFVSAQKEGYSSVPSALRKMFVYDLIRQNAEKRIFKKIINPSEEFAKDAYSFADWIAKNLPSLHLWKKRLEENRENYGNLDAEDEDYMTLYTRYSEFLEKNKLFEPGWIDDVKFSETSRHFYIMYPEQIEDFDDYDSVFSKSKNITAVLMPPDVPAPKAYEFADARSELRHTMLRMVRLVNEKKADWSEIALSVPDFESYRPYLKREFELYSIPFVIRAGQPLTKNCAGRVFSEIAACHNEEFSFDSVRTLLLDESLPWKKELRELKTELVREGNRMRCVCPYEETKNGVTEKVDVWSRALFKTSKDEKGKELLSLYHKLHHHVEQFFRENISFSDILASWYEFKGYFFDEGSFGDSEFSDSNKILSRCITHLKEIAGIQKEYLDGTSMRIDSPFEFFESYLEEKKYVPQQESEGVNIFDYRLTASANFKYQFIINASQKKIDVQKKRLSFLNAEKRKNLRLVEEDMRQNSSEIIAKLYARKNSEADEDLVHFSYCIDSFSGFSIPHSCLEIVPDDFEEAEDYILSEREWISKGAESGLKVTKKQFESLERWKNAAIGFDGNYKANPKLKEKIDFVLKENRKALDESGGNPEHIKISARGDMEVFFPCRRKWILKKVLKLKDDSLDTNLMQNYDMGSLNHKFLEKFIQKYEGSKLPWYDKETMTFKADGDSVDENGQKLLNPPQKDVTLELHEEIFENLVDSVIDDPSFSFHDSPIVIATLKSQRKAISETIWNFLKLLLLPFDTSDSAKKIGGVGNCTVCGVEMSLVSDMENFDFFGEIDCLLKTPSSGGESSFIILDYKNTKGAIPDKDEYLVSDTGTLKDFQMALYATMVKKSMKKNGAQPELCAAYYYAIKDQSSQVVFDEKDGKNTLALFEPSMAAAKEYAQILTDDVLSKKLDFTPKTSKRRNDRQKVDIYKDCASCSFKSICRTTFTVARKKLPENEKPED